MLAMIMIRYNNNLGKVTSTSIMPEQEITNITYKMQGGVEYLSIYVSSIFFADSKYVPKQFKSPGCHVSEH